MKQATIGELFAMRKGEAVKLADAVKLAKDALAETLEAKAELDVISVFGNEFKADCLVLDANALVKLSNLKQTTRISTDEAALLQHYGIAVESETLDASALKLLKSNVLKPIEAAILDRNMKLDLAEQAEVSNTRALQRAENVAETAERSYKKAVSAEYKRLLLAIAETFGNNSDKVTTKHVGEVKTLESLFGVSFPKEDNLTGSIGEFVCNELYWLASLDSATTAAVSARVEDVRSVASSMPYLCEYLVSTGTTVVRAPKGFNSKEVEDLPPVPAEKPDLVKWQECTIVEEAELGHNTVSARESRKVRESRLWELVALCRKYPQKGVLAGLRAFDRFESRLSNESKDGANIAASLGGLDRVVQGAINSAVKRAVQSGGTDLSLLNKLNQYLIIYTPGVGFALSDYRVYIEDTLPHVKWVTPKNGNQIGVWELRSQRYNENHKLGAFGVHLFGECRILGENGAPVLFPLLSLTQFRQIKKEAQSIARETNKREKERHASQWQAYADAWEAAKPVEARLACIEAELAKIDQHHEELTKQANALRHAKKA